MNLADVAWNLQVASTAALLAQHWAFARAERARKCRKQLDDAEGQFGVEKVASHNAHDDSKMARGGHLSLRLTMLPNRNIDGMRLVSCLTSYVNQLLPLLLHSKQ